MIKIRLSKYILTALVLIALSSGMAWGATYTWNIASNGNWNDSANWIDGGGFPGVPLAGDDVIISLPYTVTLDIDTPNLKTLTISLGATLDANGHNISVTDAFTNNGNFTSGSGTVIITGTGTLSGFTGGSALNNLTIDPSAALSLGAADVSITNTLTVYGQLNINGTGKVSSLGTLANNGTVDISGTGTIPTSDSDSGTFRYSANVTTSIPALGGYSTLEITGGARAQTNNFTADTLTINAPASLALGTSTVIVNTTLNNNNLIIVDGSGTISRSDSDSGTFEYTNGWSGSIPALPEAYHDLEITGGSHTQTNDLSVTNDLTIAGGTTTLSMDAYSATITGNVSGTGTLTGGSGGITVGGNFTPAAFSQTGGTLTLNGTVPAFAPTGSLGSLTVGNGASVTLGGDMTLTGNLTLNGTGAFTATSGTVAFDQPNGATSTITGDLTFHNLSCTNHGGETLTINGAVTIDTGGTLTLTGSGPGDLLNINGTGSIALPGAQTTGQYLSVSNSVSITAGSYTAYDSVFVGASRPANWNIVAGASGTATWIGVVSTNWNTGGNWDTGLVPGSGETATVGAPEVAGNNPQATAAVTTGTINVLAAGNVDFHGETITVTTINNAGQISLDGAAGQIAGTPAIANTGASKVTYSGVAAIPCMGTTYQALTIAAAGHLTLGATSITVNGTLDNNGIIEINDTAGSINKTDTTGGTFRYSTATATIPVALAAYNALEIYSGSWSAGADFTAASINVYSGATFDLATHQMTVTGTFANSGTVRISGNPSIGGTKSNIAGSTVEYYGFGCMPAWGTGYKNLSITSGGFSAGQGLTIDEKLTVSGSANATFNTIAAQTTECATADLSTSGTLSLGDDNNDVFHLTGAGSAFATPTASSLTLAGTLTASGGITLRNINTVAANLTFTNAVTLADPVTLALGAHTLTIDTGIGCTTHNFVTTGSGLVTVSASAAITATDGSLTFANPVTLGNSASISISGTGTINLNSTTGTTTIGNSASIASTGTGKITFAGTVTNDGSISAGDTGDGVTAIEFGGGYSGSGTINGNASSNPVILFSGASATISIATIAPAGDTVHFSGASQSVTPGATNTYANVECSGSGISFGNNAFSQGATANFTVSAGSVSIGTGQFIAGNLIASGGNFTQTGANGSTQSVTSISQTAGTISWDNNGTDGGTLSIGGGITGAATSVLFHHKAITFTASGSLGDSYAIYAGTINSPATITCHSIFRDLTINNGATLVADNDIRVMRNLFIDTTGVYTPGTQTLTLGGAGTETGTITVNNASVSLGTVTINTVDASNVKSAGSNLTFGALTITTGPFTSSTHNITATSVSASGQTWNASGGTIDVNVNCNIGTFNATAALALQVMGDLTLGSGSSVAAVALTLDGSGDQSFTTGGLTYSSLAVTTGGANVINVTGNLGIANALNVNANQELAMGASYSLTVGGLTTNNGTISGGSALDFNDTYTGGSGTLSPTSGITTSFAANVTFGTFTANSGTVAIDGTGNQTIALNGRTLYDLSVGTRAAGTVNFSQGFTVSHGWTVAAGAYNVTLSSGGTSNVSGTITFYNTGTLTISNGFGFAGTVIATAPQKSLNGTISTSSGDLNLASAAASVPASGAATLDGSATGAISIGATTLNAGASLTLGNSVDSNTITIGQITPNASGTETVTINNDAGTVSLNGPIGVAGNYLGTLTLSMGGAASVTFADAATALISSFDPGNGTYALTIRSDSATFTGNVNFASSGDLTLGDDGSGTDTLTFTNGLTATSQTKYIAATVEATSGTSSIDLGSTATNVTADSRIGGTATGQITLATVNIASSATLTLGAGAASPIDVTGVISGSGLGSGNVTFNTTAPTLQPSTIFGIGTKIGTMTITNVGTGNLSFTNAVGTSGSPVGSIVFANTISSAGTVTFNGAVYADGITADNATGAYDIAFDAGGTISSTSSITFDNRGALTLGNADTDDITFSNGFSTGAARPSAKYIAGLIKATSGNIDLTGTTTHVTDTAIVGGASTGNISFDAVSIAAGEKLTIGAGSANQVSAGIISGTAPGSNFTINVADTAAAGTISQIDANIGTVVIQQSGGITVTGTTTANTVTLTDTGNSKLIDFQGSATIGTLNTASEGYNVRFGGGGSITGGAATTFSNTGTLAITGASLSFEAGLTAIEPSTVSLGTTVTTSDPSASVSLGNASPSRNIDLTGTAVINTSAANGNISINGPITNPALPTPARALTLTAGTGTVTLNGTVGTAANPLGSLTVTSASTSIFRDNITVSAAGTAFGVTSSAITLDGLSVSSTNGGNAATVTAISLTGPVSLASDDVFLSTTTGGIAFSSTINGAQDLSITAGTGATNYPIAINGRIGGISGGTNILSSLSLTGSTIDLYGIGSHTLPQNGVSGTISVNATGLVSLYADDYLSGGAQTWTAPIGVVYRATADGSWNAGGGITLTPGNTDLYLDHAGHTLTVGCALTCRDLIFYNGILSLGSSTLTARNLAVFGSAYNPDDHQWDANGDGLNIATDDTRFAYYFPSDPQYAPALSTFDAPLHILTAFTHTAQFAFAASAITVTGNFYDNGAASSGACTLTLPSNASSHPTFHYGDSPTSSQWGTPYAVAFYIDGTNITVNPAGGWLAGGAAQGVTKPAPAPGTDNWQTVTPIISSVETVYDDVVHVTFNIPIENSNGEIHETIYHATAPASVRYGGAWYNGAALLFADAYSDKDCAHPLVAADGDVTSFYIKTAGGRWNTDATGMNAGNADSTDRGRSVPSTAAAHQTATPDLSFLEGLFYAADGKTMCANYGVNTATAYTATADGCAPVLVEVHTGQEAHTAADTDAGQPAYDAHNFIEFRWSEPVDITAGAVPVPASTPNMLASGSIGAIMVSGAGLDVAGLGTIANGALDSASRAHGTSTISGATHAVYRNFSLTGGTAANQPHRLRVAIAGYALDGPTLSESYKWYWPGFIRSATTPTGLVTDSATALTITDLASNNLEKIGTSAYARAPVTVSNTKSGLYGFWDVTGPAPAALRTSSDSWGDPIVAYEAVPDASGGVIDRVEMHFFDNAVNYNLATDTWAWTSRKGWYHSSDPTKAQLTQGSAHAPESFGGARPEDGAWVTTSGGIRESSLNNAIGAFRVFYNGTAMATQPNTFSTNVSTKLLAPVSNQNVAGDPYFRLYWTGAGYSKLQIAGSTITVSYNADSPAAEGYVTDLAGNLMKPFSKITCVDRTAPRITFSLAGANRDDLYVLFSKSIDFSSASDIAAGLTVNLSGTTVALTGTPDVKTSNKRAFLYHLGTKVRAADLVSALSSITIAGTGHLVEDPDTHISSETSYFVDDVGNYAIVGDSHRLTDIGIGLTEILYGSDGVNEPGLLGGQSGALRSDGFDGTGRLLDKDITIATWINLQSAPGSLSLYYDVNPSDDLMPKTFNDATGLSLKLWLPSVLSGFNLLGDQDARNLSPTVITDAARLFRNFLIPESDSEIVPGAKVQLVMQYEGLFCARLTDENDITSLAPWSFVVAETRKQRGGVTILNNVIDSNKREKTIVQVEVPKSGNVVIQVFTLDGNIVKVLERGRKGGGTYSYYWDGTNGAGNPVARGIYFIRVVGPNMDEIRKVLVVKD